MNLASTISSRILRRKLATAVLITASIAAFATLGDGGKKSTGSVVVYNFSKHFTLRSGFNYKSNNLLSAPEARKFIMLNTVITYQKGNATYVMPLKKKVLLDKVNFAPVRF
jgi:hypothetical protein